MDLLKKVRAIDKDLPKLYSQEKKKPAEIPIFCKFFDPCGSWTWYVVEGERSRYSDEKDDYDFFGYVRGLENELGYFRLSELASVKGKMGLGIEMDLHFGKHMLFEAMEKQI